MNAMPMPTLRGWWTFQNTSTSARVSGTQAIRPHGSTFTMNAASASVNAMNAPLAGSSRYSVPGVMGGDGHEGSTWACASIVRRRFGRRRRRQCVLLSISSTSSIRLLSMAAIGSSSTRVNV
jgi:hypothetical protein